MMDKLICRIVDFLEDAAVISREERDIYSYGLDVLLFALLNLCILFTGGFILGAPLETMLLFLLFGLLQSFGGGYHARSHLRCFLGMLSVFALFLLMNALPCALFTSLGAVGSLLILPLSPVPHPNAPASEEKRRRCKAVTRGLCLGILVMHGILLLFPHLHTLNHATAASLFASGCSMLLAALQRKWRTREIRWETSTENYVLPCAK